MKKLTLITLLLFVFACKEESKAKPDNTPVEVKKEINKELEVIISFKTNKIDDFKLLLNNIVIDEFQKKNVHIVEKTEPTTSFQTITGKFGENNISNNFNINFGTKEIKTIEIESIQLSYGTNSLAIEGSQLEEYFSITKFISYDKTKSELKTQRVDGKYYPIIILKRKAINILKKEE